MSNANSMLHGMVWSLTTIQIISGPHVEFSFKQHALNTKAKLNIRNNLLRKLTNSRWGAHPATVQTTALVLCFSTAEFACSLWGHSRRTGHVDIALNDTCRIITGCLKAKSVLSDTLAEWEILSLLPAILELRNQNFF